MARRRSGRRDDRGGGKSFFQRLGPLAGGLFGAILLGLTLLAAVVLGMQEQDLVAVAAPSATATALPSATATPTPQASPVLPADAPTSAPTATPLPPSATPRPTAQARCVPPSNWRLYVVRRGESLSTLAWRYWTSERSLVQANCLSRYAVSAGQRIYVPDVSPRQSCGRPSGWVAYTIRRGDTLSSIAARVGTTVSALKRANCLSSDKILAGATLWVPRLPAPPPPTATRRPTSTPRPTRTPSPTSGTGTPTDTPEPTGTAAPGTPTDTPEPTGTAAPGTPTNTPTEPPPTNTPTEPPPTNTPTEPPPPPTNTPTDPPPPPTNTPTDPPPPPTNTPPPPTNTPTDPPPAEPP